MEALATTTIPTDNPELARAIAKCKPGEKLTISATLTANDESGLTVDIDSVTPEYKKKKRVSPVEYAKQMRRKKMRMPMPEEEMAEGEMGE